MQQKLVPLLSDLIKKFSDYKEKLKQKSMKNSELKEKKSHNNILRFQLLKKVKEITAKIELDQNSTDTKPTCSRDDQNKEARKTLL